MHPENKSHIAGPTRSGDGESQCSLYSFFKSRVRAPSYRCSLLRPRLVKNGMIGSIGYLTRGIL